MRPIARSTATRTKAWISPCRFPDPGSRNLHRVRGGDTACLKGDVMQIPKSSEQDREWFRSVIPPDPSVEIKPMFGNLGAFVNGNMFAGLFGQTVGVKLDDA